MKSPACSLVAFYLLIGVAVFAFAAAPKAGGAPVALAPAAKSNAHVGGATPLTVKVRGSVGGPNASATQSK